MLIGNFKCFSMTSYKQAVTAKSNTDRTEFQLSGDDGTYEAACQNIVPKRETVVCETTKIDSEVKDVIDDNECVLYDLFSSLQQTYSCDGFLNFAKYDKFIDIIATTLSVEFIEEEEETDDEDYAEKIMFY